MIDVSECKWDSSTVATPTFSWRLGGVDVESTGDIRHVDLKRVWVYETEVGGVRAVGEGTTGGTGALECAEEGTVGDDAVAAGEGTTDVVDGLLEDDMAAAKDDAEENKDLLAGKGGSPEGEDLPMDTAVAEGDALLEGAVLPAEEDAEEVFDGVRP